MPTFAPAARQTTPGGTYTMRDKTYGKTAAMYAERLRGRGYTCRFNWTDADGSRYDCVSVCGRMFCGHGGEFSTPKAAWDYITRHG